MSLPRKYVRREKLLKNQKMKKSDTESYGKIVAGAFAAVSTLVRLRCVAPPRSSVRPTAMGRNRWRWAVFLLLALFQRSQAYVTVSMKGLCKQSGFNSLSLFPSTATSLLLDTSGSLHSSCKMEIVAPETHSISLLYTRKKKSPERKRSETLFPDEHRTAKCLLTVSFPLIRPDDEFKLRLDLCSEEAFSNLDQFIDVLPSRVTLEWNPTVKNVDDILVSEIVVAALGKGRDICSQPGQLFCNPKYPLYCISKDLVCDGKRNCPEGSDEEKELCSLGANRDKSLSGKSHGDTAHIGHDWEFLASEVLKKLSSKESGSMRKPEVSTSSEKSTVLWSDDGNAESDESESLPDVLKHYGPWGYLMLGMLICGTVLMFCGLWECCCRKPKSSASAPAGPTLLIINQGAQQGDVETPQTPGPPRYEDLDQPPSYATLFPTSKASEPQGSVLPIAIPIVDSLANLLTNTSSSQSNPNVSQNLESIGHSTSSSSLTTGIFTIDLRRDVHDSESSPK